MKLVKKLWSGLPVIAQLGIGCIAIFSVPLCLVLAWWPLGLIDETDPRAGIIGGGWALALTLGMWLVLGWGEILTGILAYFKRPTLNRSFVRLVVGLGAIGFVWHTWPIEVLTILGLSWLPDFPQELANPVVVAVVATTFALTILMSRTKAR